MPSNALSTISKPQGSSSDIARQWLVKFAEICQREFTPALAEIWAEQLRDIAPELLQRACDHVAKTWTSAFLPTPGNIRAQIDQANSKAFRLETEQAWQFALEFCTRSYHPDMGVRRAPELPAAINHAINAAGGMNFIYNCSREELVWAKKRFTEDFTNVHETGKIEHLLTDSEALRILRRIVASPQSNSQLIIDSKAAKPTLPTATNKSGPTKQEANQATENAVAKSSARRFEKSDAEYAEEIQRQKAALIERGYLPAEGGAKSHST